MTKNSVTQKPESQTRSWRDWWSLLKRTPCTDVFRGVLSGSLPTDRKWHASLIAFFSGRAVEPSSILKETGLPEVAQQAILRIARSVGRTRRVQSKFVREFVEGLRDAWKISPEQPMVEIPIGISDRLSEAIPLRSLDRLGVPQLCVVHTLPPELAKLIERVVRQTRLWKSERIEIARELLNHCEEGLEAGVSSEAILSEFGDASNAARLIRRAKIRQRPWIWHVQHRCLQGIGILSATALVAYCWFAIRFLTATPTIKRDYIGEIDLRAQSIPEEKRAWPLYREALMKVREDRVMPILKSDRDLLSIAADSPDWETILAFLGENREVLDLTFRAAEKPEFGFVYRDPVNREWLERTNGKGSAESQISSTRGVLTGVLLPHIQDLRKLHRLLQFEAIAAGRSHDRERWLRAVKAMHSMGEQQEEGDFLIIRLVAFSYVRTAWRHCRYVLAVDPGMLTDQDLRDLAHRVAGFGGGGRLTQLPDNPLFFEDLLQRYYTDDGDGDGRLNPLYFVPEEIARTLASGNGEFGNVGGALSLGTKLKGAALSATIASRAELREALREIEILEAREAERPLWERTADQPSPLISLLKKWDASAWYRHRYAPVLKLYSPFIDDGWQGHPGGEFATLHRDATLVAFALTIHHRRHHAWPTDLEQLAPSLLPSVPLDRFDGKPLKYKVIEGVPLLYSVGKNRTDERGSPAKDPSKEDEAPEGDLRFWPVE